MNCRICQGALGEVCMEFHEPDEREKRAGISSEDYKRAYFHCDNCGSFQSTLNFQEIESDVYHANYYEQIDEGSISRKFNLVMGLPSEKSDNAQRVKRVLSNIEFYRENLKLMPGSNHLDVGCGTGVFLAKLMQYSIELTSTALEPDQSACSHLKEVLPDSVKVLAQVVRPGFSEEKYDLITMNRVLEHMPQPREVLQILNNSLKDHGLIYIEVPDVLTLEVFGKEDGAFSSDHLNIYSPEGLFRILEDTGFTVLNTQRVQDPSGKLTLFAVATKKGSGYFSGT